MSNRRMSVRAGLLLLCLLCFGLLFQLWPGLAQFEQSDWKTTSVSPEEEQIAIDNYRQYKYLSQIGYYQQRFPASTIETSLEQYVWLITERLDYLAVILICYFLRPPKEFVIAYLVVKTGDFVDHLVHYNEKYYMAGPFPVTFNIVAILSFALFLGFWYIARKYTIL